MYENLKTGYGVYNIAVESTSGNQPSPNTLAKIADLATKIAGLWVPGAAAVAPLVNTAAADIDAIRSIPGATNQVYSAVVLPTPGVVGNPRTGTRVAYASPRNLGKNAGEFVFYTRKSASIVLDGTTDHDITDGSILQNDLLGTPHNCLTGIAPCAAAATFGEGIKSTLQTDASGNLKKEETWGKVFGECKRIQTQAKIMHLSTIDQLLAKWALLVNANLLDTWSSPTAFVAACAPATDTSDRGKKVKDAIDAAQKGLFTSGECWTDADNKRLHAIERIMNRSFKGASLS